MVDMLHRMFSYVARIHNRILSLNDSGGFALNDKQLHFLVIGVLGMALIFVVYPLFKYLAAHNHTLVIAWIYVFTLLMGLSFAIEIGQRLSGSGTMDFADIYYGISGFLIMFLLFAVVRGIYHLILRYRRRRKSGAHSRH